MRRLVVILNGPPGIGKDTLANALCNSMPFAKGAFKDTLYEHTAKFISNVCRMQVTTEDVRNRNECRELKERPWYKRTSVRRWLQITSEAVVKPYAGADFFGKAAADKWYALCCPVIVADGGFSEEVEAVCNKFGNANVVVLRLRSPGYNFGTDTRNYIDRSAVPCSVMDVQVPREDIAGTVSDLKQLITGILNV